MTDTRIPEHWLTDPTIDALSDVGFRVSVNAMVWAVAHGTDGAIPDRALRLLHPDGVQLDAVRELVAAGRWAQTDSGHLIVDFLDHQTAAADIEAARKAARDKKSRQRRHAAGDHDLCRPGTCPDLSTSDVPPGQSPGHPGGQDRGRPPVVPEDRTGQEAVRGDHLLSDSHARDQDDELQAWLSTAGDPDVADQRGLACSDDHRIRFGDAGSPDCTRCAARNPLPSWGPVT